MNRTQYLESLASEGLRIASSDESGWTHGYYNDARGEKVATWITDAPAIVLPAEVAQIANQVGVTESQVQGIIDFENAQRETENAQTIFCNKCHRIQPVGNAHRVEYSEYNHLFVGWCAECMADEAEKRVIEVSLRYFDWEWCQDALLKTPCKKSSDEYEYIAEMLRENKIEFPNTYKQRDMCYTMYVSDVKYLLKCFDAYLPWETPEVREDLRELMTDIRRQAGMQLA